MEQGDRGSCTDGLVLELLVLQERWARVRGEWRGVTGVGFEEPLFHCLVWDVGESVPGRNDDVVGSCWDVHAERTSAGLS